MLTERSLAQKPTERLYPALTETEPTNKHWMEVGDLVDELGEGLRALEVSAAPQKDRYVNYPAPLRVPRD